MRATRRGFLRGAVAVAASFPITLRWTTATAAPSPAPSPASPTSYAQPSSPTQFASHTQRLSVQPPAAPALLQAAVDWTDWLPGQSVRRVFAPASGALLAATDTALLRSDDAGVSWRALPLPSREPGSYLGVDPTNHDTLYAATPAGLQRSDDAGASWSAILTPTLRTVHLAVSPADPCVLYVAHYDQSSYRLLRSLDGGMSWEQLEEAQASMCGFGVYILAPHQTDSARIFRATGCYAGRNLGDSLEQSRDHGSTFQVVFTPKTAYPMALVGGGGADPGRFYQATNKDFREGGSQILTSVDDAATWTAVLDNIGGGTMQGSKVPSVTVTGLAYDPSLPDRVFLSQRQQTGSDAASATHAVSASVDGGVSWSGLGRAPLPEVRQLALGVDGRNLFAATASGLLGIAVA